MKEVVAKTGVAGLWAVLAHYMDNVTSLVWLLVIFETADYITGMIAGAKNGGLSSRMAIWGFVKKLCYFVLVGVGHGVDFIIAEAVGVTGIAFNYPAIFGALSVCYLLSTEAISILENLNELGVEVPFLSNFIKKARDKIADKGGEEKKGD